MGLFLELALTFGLKFPALTTKTLTTEVRKCFLNNVYEHWVGKNPDCNSSLDMDVAFKFG